MDPSKIANVAAQIETMNVTSDNSAAAADKVEEVANTKGEQPSSAGAKHLNFAGRYPAGVAQPITIGKNGVRHVSCFLASLERAHLVLELFDLNKSN